MRRQVLELSVALLLAACAKKEEAGPAYTLDAGPDVVQLATHHGFHINPDYPVNFKTEDGGRTDVKASMQTTPCAGDAEQACAADMRVPNEGGVLAFSVCSKDVCNIEKVPLSRR